MAFEATPTHQASLVERRAPMSRGKLLGWLTLAACFATALAPAALAQNATPVPPSGPSRPGDPAADQPSPESGMPVDPAVSVPPTEAAPEKNLLFDAPSQGFANLMGPAVGHMQPRADYREMWFPEVAVKGQPTNLSEERQEFSATCPLWQDPTSEWSATFHVRSELYQTSAVLPLTNQAFPLELWDVRLGTNYRHLFDNGWIAGGGVSVGSASDKPFHSYDELTMGVNAFLRIPQGDHNAWLFTLAYSANSELPFPVPGVAFIWQPSDCLRINVGLPFAVLYRPTDKWTFEFSYMLIRSVHARATYRLLDRLRIYGGYDWSNEGYFLADREDIRDRFFSYDQRVGTGLQYLLGRQALLDLGAGYSFDRFFFEGRQYSSNNLSRVDVGDGAFLSLRFEYRF